MLNITQISDTDYISRRYNFLSIAEANISTPYIDSRRNVSIGIGFNLHDAAIRDRVLTEIGIGSGTQTYANLSNILREQYDQTEQDNVNRRLSANGLTALTPAQTQNIFNGLIPSFETDVNSWMQRYGIPTIGNSREPVSAV